MDESTITAYLNGELSKKEVHDFETQMQQNISLTEKVKRQKQIQSAIEYESYHYFFEKVKNFESTLPKIKEIDHRPPVPIITKLRPLLIAASTLLIIFVSVVYVKRTSNQKKTNRSEWITSVYNKPDFRGALGGAADIEHFNKAISKFDADLYPEAIELLNSIPTQSTLYLPAQYVTAHCYLVQKNYATALNKLALVEKQVDSWELYYKYKGEIQKINRDDIYWTKALCLIGNNQLNQAQQILMHITPDAPYYNNAQQLLNKIVLNSTF